MPDDRVTLAADPALDLPAWNLADLYPGPDAPDVAADLAAGAAEAAAFRATHEGRLASLTPDGFAAALRQYDAQSERLGRLGSYAFLYHSTRLDDPEAGRFFQTIHERTTEIWTDLLFFQLELNRLGDEDLARLVPDGSAGARFRPWLAQVRAFRPHQLSDEVERTLHERGPAGAAAWVRLYDETMARLRFPVDGQMLTDTQASALLTGPDAAKRKAAGIALGTVLAEHAPLFALVTNTLAKEKEVDDRQRRYARPDSFRNLANQVEDGVVDALVAAVRAAWPRLSHRYYAWKARRLGVERLPFWDRLAPLPGRVTRAWSWEEARQLVLDSYAGFSGELAALGRRFFEHAWIDVPPRPGKRGGAFAHPTVPGAHPYLLLNFQGRVEDVTTLAHELGHGVHQLLAGAQGQLLCGTPLTLAETASVFGEQLTFQALLAAEPDPAQRTLMLAKKVEEMLGTVTRQVAFYEFERRVHTERKQGELPPARLDELWLEIGRESLGPAIELADPYRHNWAGVPHFIHSPFYVYAYAFGDCLVNALWGVYQREGGGGTFARRYLELLRAGGTKRHGALLAPFGLDAADPGFWQIGLDVIGSYIDRLEAAG